MIKNISVIFLIGFILPFTFLWANPNTDNVSTVQTNHDGVQATAPTLKVESTDRSLDSEETESGTGAILLGAAMTAVFFSVLFLSLILLGKIYKKRSLNNIKRVLINDHN